MSLLSNLLGRKPPADAGETEVLTQRVHSIDGSEAADLAAQLLCAPSALLQLSHEEARKVVTYMRPHRISEGTTFIREGDTQHTHFMLLVLDGQVTVETIVVSRTQPITVTVLGAGSLIGEMGLLDGEPRSASCTAMTDLRCAILTRRALKQLLADDPPTAAKLMVAVSLRIAERMRECQDKLKMYAQLTLAMNQEINALMPP